MLIDASVDVGAVGVTGIGDDMMGIMMGVVAAVAIEMKESVDVEIAIQSMSLGVVPELAQRRW